MALLDRIKGIFTRGANISLENPSVSIGDVLAEGIFSTDIIVNEATILSIPAVKRAIGVIASCKCDAKARRRIFRKYK